MEFKRFKIDWSDTFPSILDEEVLLVECNLKPKIGDVILRELPSGEIYFHRLIHKFFGYYVTWGENKKSIDLPWKIKNYKGVCVGKYKKIQIKLSMKILLDFFILFFVVFKISEKWKKNIFIYMSYLYSLDQTFWYGNDYENDLVNSSIYPFLKQEIQNNYPPMNLKYSLRKCIDNKITLNSWFFKKFKQDVFEHKLKNRNILLDEFKKVKEKMDTENLVYTALKGAGYAHEREMGDIDLIVDSPEKLEEILHSFGYYTKYNNKLEIECRKMIDGFDIAIDIHRIFPSVCYNFEFPLKKKFSLNDYDNFLICCTHTYQQAFIYLKDILDINYILEKIDLQQIKLDNKGIYEILGGPLILTYLFDKRYNNTKNKNLEELIQKNYPKELLIFENYLNKRNWEMPISLLHLYDETRVFNLYKFLREPREYPLQDFLIKKLINRSIVKIKAFKIKRYCLLER